MCHTRTHKGLQKKAEAAEGRKRLAENAAFSMRAKAKRLAASALAPLADDSSLPPPPPLPPPDAAAAADKDAEEARRRAKAKKKHEAAAAAMAVTAAKQYEVDGAAAVAPAGQQHEVGPHEEATREEQALARAREAVAGLAHGQVARAFRTWRDARAEMHERLMLLARTAALWSQPSLSFAFRLWAEQQGSRRVLRLLLGMASSSHTKAVQRRAMAAWQALRQRRRAAMRLRLDAQQGAAGMPSAPESSSAACTATEQGAPSMGQASARAQSGSSSRVQHADCGDGAGGVESTEQAADSALGAPVEPPISPAQHSAHHQPCGVLCRVLGCLLQGRADASHARSQTVPTPERLAPTLALPQTPPVPGGDVADYLESCPVTGITLAADK